MADATHCTIELTHGRIVHVGMPFEEVEAAWRQALMRHGATLRLWRIENDPAAPNNARRWREFAVRADAIVAVFPMGQASAAPPKGRRFIGIEKDERYADIADARIAHWTAEAARTTGKE